MKDFIKFLFFVFLFVILSNCLIGIAEEPKIKKNIKLHDLPIQSKRNNLKPNQIKLKNLPLPLIEVASKSVNSERNPFLRLNKRTEEIGINPKKFFTLTGIVQTGNQLSAMLESSDGLNIFKEGEYINKDLKIKQISLDNETVIFTNGKKEFELKFSEK